MSLDKSEIPVGDEQMPNSGQEDKLYKVVVTATWTHFIDAPDEDSAYEMVACQVLPDLTLENMDDGSFYVEEPVIASEYEASEHMERNHA